MNDYPTIVLAGIGAIQSLLFAILVFSKKKHKKQDRLLVVWFIVFFIHLSLVVSKEFLNFSLQEELILNMSFLHGPFLLLYVKSLKKQYWAKIDNIHLLPFSVFLLLSLFYLEDLKNKWEIIVLGPKLLSLVIYPVYVLSILPSRSRVRFENANSLRWVKTIALLFLLSTSISILRMVVELSVGIPYFRFWDMLRYVILIIIIGFFGLRYGTLYELLLLEHDKHARKYKTSPLGEDDFRKIRIEIERIFEIDKPYLNPNFSLEELAQLLSVAKHHLSQILNAEMNTSFYTLVNQKRIQHSLKLLNQYETLSLTIEGIGYECGFSSKSSFFQNFKKEIGLTPGQYIKKK